VPVRLEDLPAGTRKAILARGKVQAETVKRQGASRPSEGRRCSWRCIRCGEVFNGPWAPAQRHGQNGCPKGGHTIAIRLEGS